MSTCRGCGAKIEWLVLPSGKKMPVDANAAGLGKIRVLIRGEGRDLLLERRTLQIVKGRRLEVGTEERVIQELKSTGQEDRILYCWVPHWSTCPVAKRFHKSKAEPSAAALAKTSATKPVVEEQGRLF